MRRKSFISPCKQINTDMLFKNIHHESSHCKSMAVEEPPFKLHRTKIFGMSTDLDFGRTQGRWSMTTKSSAGKKFQFDSRERCRSFAADEHTTPLSRLRFLKVATIDRNPTSDSFKNNSMFSLKELLAARPNTSYNYSIEDSEGDHLRPLTNAIGTRFRPRHSRALTKEAAH